MDRARRWLEPVLFFALLALLWQYGVTWFGLRRYVLPPLSEVLTAGWKAREELAANALVTAIEVAAGFALSVAGGAALGLLIHASASARRTLYPLVTALQSLPKIALAPLMMVWFGYGFTSRIASAVLFALFPVAIATVGGLASVPRHLEEHFRALGANPWDTFRRLRMPAALPGFVDGVRISTPLAVIGTIAGEFVGGDKGLGHLILFATANGRTDLMFAVILTITALALAFYALVEAASRLVWWRGLAA